MAKGNLAKGLSGILGTTGSDLLSGLGDGEASRGSSGGFTSGGRPLEQLLQTLVRDLQLKPEVAERVAEAAARVSAALDRLLDGGLGAGESDTELAASALRAGGKAGGGVAVSNLVVPGTSAGDVLTGTEAVDTIFGNSGADTISAFGGDDSLYGGSGGDTIAAGTGNDTAEGGLGNDVITGGDGNDYIYDGGPSQTFLSGAETLVSVNDPVLGPPNAFPPSANDAQSHTDQLAFASARTDGSGGYMTVWGQGIGSNQAPSQAMRVQYFDAQGNPVGPTGGLRVDQLPNNPVQTLPELGPFETKDEIKVVGLLGAQAGRAVIVLSSELNGVFDVTERSHNYILLLGPGTTPSLLDAEVLSVNASGQATNQSQVAPSVVALNDGSIVVAWQEDVRDPADGAGALPTDSHVYVQRFTINGSNQLVPVGAPTEIASNTNGNQTQPEATLLANGNVVLVYNTGSADYGTVGNLQRHGDDDDGSDYDVAFRIWNPSTGTFVGNQVTVNTTTAGNQYVFNKSVTLLSNGNFVVSWTGDTSAGGPSQVYVRVFNQAGTAVTAQIAISDLVSATNPNMDATVTALADGGFFVVWTRDDTTTNNKDIWGQRFRADGTEVGSEFQINTAGDTTAAPNALAEDQRRPNVTTLANGTVVVTWDSGRYAQEPGFSNRDEEVMQRLIRFGGNNGDDSMAGGTGIDLVFGESGNDKLWGGDADDSLFGATGADTLFGDAGLDRMFGGLGNDTAAGGLAVDTLMGESGADTLDGGSGADTLLGGSGQDWANYTNAAGVAVTIDLSFGAAQSGTGSEGFGDVVSGIEHIFGSAFADTLSGDGNVNSLLGNDSNDTLAGRGGGDWLDGGAGIDTADYRASAAGVQVILGDGSPESGGDAQGDQLTRIEVIHGSSFADIFGSQAAAATFFGNEGNDLLLARLGAERFEGGSGGDAASYVNSASAVTVDLTAGTGSGGSAAGDSYSGVETLIGSSGNDDLRGAGVAGTPDLINGGSGADLLRHSLGRDSLVGGSGLDTVTYDGKATGVHVDLATGSQFDIIAGDPDDTLFGIENLVGSSAADTLLGSAGANTLAGGDGNDRLAGRGGADSLVGGSGIDTADYTESAAAVQVILGDGVAESGGDAAGDSLTLVEVIQGSSFADSFGSQVAAATFFGNAGDDVLQARLGAERLEGGAGNDQANYLLSTLGVTVNLASGLGSGGFAAGDSYSAVENVVGSSFVDTLIGSAGNNSLDGQAGDDLLAGGNGLDILLGGQGVDLLEGGSGADVIDGGAGIDDTATYANSSAAVTVDMSDAAAEIGGEAQGDQLTEIEHLIGSDFADSLNGSAAVNRVFGESGGDLLGGGLGADSLFGGSGNDAMAFDSLDAVLMGGVGRDTLLGNSAGDVIQMSQARWHFAGAFASFETLLLGDGNDFYNGSTLDADYLQIDALVDGIVIFGGSGNDSLNMRGNTALQGNNDSVYGGLGRDNIWGGGGDDSLFGDDGDDALYGGFGADRISGGAGFDVTYLGRGEGDDAILDSEGLVLFWGNEPAGGFYDGVDPSEVMIFYGASNVTLSFSDGSASATFDKGSVEIINLFDFGNGDAGNGAAPPPAYARDIWSASWDSGSQTFTAFTKVVDG